MTGIDMTPEMLAKARTAARGDGSRRTSRSSRETPKASLPGEAFDVVISNGVIDLIPDKDAVFSELHRVLAPGGRSNSPT